MKKVVIGVLVIVTAFGFLSIKSDNAYAMNNESAAMLAGAIAIFGQPVMHAVVNEVFRPPVYRTYIDSPGSFYSPAPARYYK